MKSIPIHLLVEGQEHVITVELSSGITYRGKLTHSEDNMNMQLNEVTATAVSGEKSYMNSVFVRGSHIQMVILPEVLRYAPALRPDLTQKAKGELKARRNTQKAKMPPRKQPKVA